MPEHARQAAVGVVRAIGGGGAPGPPSREPSGQSLNSSVSQRPTRPGGATGGASATRSCSARPELGGQAVDRLAGRPAARPRSARPTLTRTRPPKRSQLVPLMAIGTSGTPERSAKYAAPSLSGSRSASPGVDPALAGDRDHAARCRSRATRRVASRRSFLPGLVRDRGAGPDHDPVAAAHAHVLLLRPEEGEARPPRQGRHEHERVRPAQVVEAVDRRSGREPLATLQPGPRSRPASWPTPRAATRSSGSSRRIGWTAAPGRGLVAGSWRARRPALDRVRVEVREPVEHDVGEVGGARRRRDAARSGRARRSSRRPGRPRPRSASPRPRGSRAGRRRAGGPPRGTRPVPACRARPRRTRPRPRKTSVEPGRLERRGDDRAVGRRRDGDRTVGGDPPDGLDRAVDARRALARGSGRPRRRRSRARSPRPGMSRSRRSRIDPRPAARVRAHHRGLVVGGPRAAVPRRERRSGPRPTRSRSRRGRRRGRR